MERMLYWIAYGLLFLWQLPQNIVALCMMPFLGAFVPIKSSRWSTCYMAEKMSGGISLGSFCFVSKNLARRETAVRHEVDGHTKQSRILGPLYLLIIGLPSLLNAWLGLTPCYYDFYTERLANDAAGLKVDEDCRLQIDGAEAEGLRASGSDPMGMKNNPDTEKDRRG